MSTRRRKPPYECCRCGYRIQEKGAMVKHLYKLKKNCPGIQNHIELTDEIKECILNNRVYHMPKDPVPPPTVCNIMNTFNTMNNYISQLNPIDKLTKYMDYNKNELICIDQSIEEKYMPKCERLQKTQGYRHGLEFKKQDLLEIIDDVSNVCNGNGLEELNIMYDSKSNKLSLYGIDQEKEWKQLLVASGIKKIIELIQEYYLNSYECYLARRLFDDKEKAFHKQICKEQLEEYYKFIGCFDVDPYVKGHFDNEILFSSDDDEFYTDSRETSIQDELYPMYKKIRDKTTKCDINSTKREVLDLIKRNTQKNVTDLNNKVVELFRMDEDFKNEIMKSVC